MSQRLGSGNPRWTPEDEREVLDEVFGDEDQITAAVARLAVKQGRTPGQVAAKARLFGINVRHHNVSDAHPIASNEEQDFAFQMAMRKAIRSRFESPPIGIDRRPCTRAPRIMEARAGAVGASIAGMLVDLGD